MHLKGAWAGKQMEIAMMKCSNDRARNQRDQTTKVWMDLDFTFILGAAEVRMSIAWTVAFCGQNSST